MVNIILNLPEDTTELEDKFTDILSDILIKKIDPGEVNRVIEILKDEKLNIRI